MASPTKKMMSKVGGKGQAATPPDFKKMKVADINGYLEDNPDLNTAEFQDLGLKDKRAAVADHWAAKHGSADAGDDVENAAQEDGPEEDKPKAATKGKGKATSVTKPKEGEVLGPDLLVKISQEVESIKTADKALTYFNTAQDDAKLGWFRVGAALSVIQENGWFGESDSFREFVAANTDMRYRHAAYYVSTYRRIVETNIPWEKIKHLGYTKVMRLAAILDEDNWEGWVKYAEAHTVREIMRAVDDAQKDPDAETTETKKNTVSKTFQLHPDQHETVTKALETAMSMSGTDSASAALEYALLEWMGTGGGTKKGKAAETPSGPPTVAHLKAQFKTLVEASPDDVEAQIDPVLEAFAATWPSVNVTVGLDEEGEAE